MPRTAPVIRNLAPRARGAEVRKACAEPRAGRVLAVNVMRSRGRACAHAQSLGVETDLATADINPSDLRLPVHFIGSVVWGVLDRIFSGSSIARLHTFPGKELGMSTRRNEGMLGLP